MEGEGSEGKEGLTELCGSGILYVRACLVSCSSAGTTSRRLNVRRVPVNVHSFSNIVHSSQPINQIFINPQVTHSQFTSNTRSTIHTIHEYTTYIIYHDGSDSPKLRDAMVGQGPRYVSWSECHPTLSLPPS